MTLGKVSKRLSRYKYFETQCDKDICYLIILNKIAITSLWAQHNQRSAHTVYLCVLCGSEAKQRLFPYTVFNGWKLDAFV